MIVAMVVLGGIGHLPGVIVGALLLAALPEVLRYVAGPLQIDDRRPARRLDPAPAAGRAGDDRHHAVAAARPVALARARQGRARRRSRRTARRPGGAAAGRIPTRARRPTATDRAERDMPEADDGKVVLEVAGVSKRFGGLQALSDVGITIEEGQVYGLIGPNGAGKTTFFNVLTGLYTPDSGTFELGGSAVQAERGARGRQGRHRAHVPEHPPVRRHDRARERDGRPPRANPLRA